MGEFNSQVEDWRSYTERLQNYFIANDIKSEAKQRAILLSVCGPRTYKLIRSLLSPKEPKDTSLADIVKQMTDHYQPKPSIIVQRFKFHSRSRKPGESVATYIAELKRLSEDCDFGDFLQEMLRDRIVCGINDPRIQRRLLAEPELTYKSAFELAQSMETAEQNTSDLQAASSRSEPRNKSEDFHYTPRAPFQPRTPPRFNCYRCGGNHKAPDCKYKDAICNSCKKKGHLARVCRSAPANTEAPRNRKQQRQQANSQSPAVPPRKDTKTAKTHHLDAGSDQDEYNLFTVTSSTNKPLTVSLTLNGANSIMEIDTGAARSVISDKMFTQLWPKDLQPPLKPTNAILKTYTGENIKPLGVISVQVEVNNQKQQLELLVVPGNGPCLLGRDWLSHLRLDWAEIHHISHADSLQVVLDRHTTVFKESLGRVEGVTAKIHVDSTAQPKFFKARPVPYALREKLEKELDHLVKEGVIQPVTHSDWATPVVPVVKRDGSVRLCGDYKITVNKVAKFDSYPLPRIDDLFASLSGGKTFTKLDLAHAYLQVPLDAESKKFTTINTHRGLYEYNRLPFGISSAPAIFQRTIENTLQNLSHTCVYLDDILITGKTETEHIRNLEEALTCLEKAGLRLKKQKCSFMLTSVDYLGHTISSEGLQPTREKVRAIKDAPTPTNVAQLRSFLGLVNYYGKFLPQLATTLAPLYSLLRQDSKWNWTDKQQKAFEAAKDQLSSGKLLVHYDPDRELVLACDASPYGIGAVLSQICPDGNEKPVAFASRSLAPAERKYSQLDKEGLSIVFGVRKFHQYLFGRKFTVQSDHKPLQHIFGETRPVPHMASARLQRWALTLGAYNYNIRYKPGNSHNNADMLSRLPLPESPPDIPLPGETILLLEQLHSSPITAAQIKQWTNQDPVLSRVRNYVSRGWQSPAGEQTTPYYQCREELSIQDGCLLRGSRVVVPPAGRQAVLELLHESHPGVSRMKNLARSYVWWPNIDKDIDMIVKTCYECQQTRHSPPVAPLHPWEWPQRPWARIHIDYAGPVEGKMLLVVVDAHSKWLDVAVVTSATSSVTIEKLRSMFATHGIPEIVVSDNGTVFTSDEFETFMTSNGIRHIKSAPYHPSTNGLTERAIQTLKGNLKKSKTGPLETRISRFLFKYRTTPHTTTGISPAELLMGRQLRSHLSILHPDFTIQTRVTNKQQRQKNNHDSHASKRHLTIGDTVFVRDFPAGKNWLPGTVTQSKGPLSFLIKLVDGRVIRRHIDHIRERSPLATAPLPIHPSRDDDWPDDIISHTPNPPNQSHDALRRSSRHRKPPDRLHS